ncbi:response regulator transcription factor [Desulfosporosinus fructosivorans]
MNNSSVLIVDDEEDIRKLLAIYLKSEGVHVLTAANGLEALAVLERSKVDLIILDIMMPRMDGIQACMKIRQENNMPIIMVSAKNEDIDKILGLNVGADDYIAKPFNPLEVVARVKSQLRRFKDLNDFRPTSENEIKINGLTINTATHEVKVDGMEVKLTPLEFSILEILTRNRGIVLSSERIYTEAWNEPFRNSDNTVAVHIRNIREKIEVNPKEPKYIKVIWGVGYKVEKYNNSVNT